MKRNTSMYGAADVVLYAPSSELASSPSCRTARRNPDEYPSEMTRRRLSREAHEIACPPESLQVYAGNDGLLVRTALIRSAAYAKNADAAPVITGSESISKLCRHLAYADQEHMVVIAIDSRLRAVAIFEAAIGGSMSTQTEMGHVIKIPLLVGTNAAAVVHNHPSGDSWPSKDDVKYTRDVRDALRCIGVKLIDHVIIGLRGDYSFLDGGHLD